MPKTKIPTAGSDPRFANRTRIADRNLDRMVRSRMVIRNSTGRIPRRRKDYLYRVERANLRSLIIQVAQDLAVRKGPQR